MPGSATLNDAVLIDSLLPTIDELRGELHPEFGVRAFRFYSVVRTWTGRRPGEGSKSDVVTEYLPQPLVEAWNGYRYELVTCGLNALGEIRLIELSLTYTYPEVAGALLPNQEMLYRLSEAHGQEQPHTYWVQAEPPYPDRVKTLGWILKLKRFQGAP
jgi:hypothetical protein